MASEGIEALGPLGRILTHENPMVVVAGVIAVKEAGRVEGLALLKPLARRHKDALVREEALEAYTELKGKLEREKNPVAPVPDERRRTLTERSRPQGKRALIRRPSAP